MPAPDEEATVFRDPANTSVWTYDDVAQRGHPSAVLVPAILALALFPRDGRNADRLVACAGLLLRGEGSETLRELRAVRYDYDPDHGSLLLRTSPG